MRAPGILELLQLGAVLLFALPMGIYGGQLLLAGRPLFGTALLAVAGGMVLAERLLTDPLDPGDLAERALGWVTGGRDRENRK